VLATLSLDGLSAIAQTVLAATALAALGAAIWQVVVTRSTTRRERVLKYSVPLTGRGTATELHELGSYFRDQGHSEYERLPKSEQLEMMRLPNLIEEIAALYNRKALDRDFAALLLGQYVEPLWDDGATFIQDMRIADESPRLFVEWQEMQTDTRKRRS
jgi:hypothetical protein